HGLRTAIGAAWIHRMRSVAQQCDAAEGPPINRVSIHHWIFEDLISICDQLSNIQPLEAPILVGIEEVFKCSAFVPIIHTHLGLPKLGYPVDQLISVAVDVIKDGIDYHLTGVDRPHTQISPAIKDRLVTCDTAPHIDSAVGKR